MAIGPVALRAFLKTLPIALKKFDHLTVHGFRINAAASAATALMGCIASNTQPRKHNMEAQ
jgi:hypothetical protein